MASLKEKFIEGCARGGASEAVGRSLWAKIEVAADYAFNKAHAACYALIAYRTAYLRANYPAEYMAALISSVMSTKDRVPFYVTECADMGLEVLPPDVNTSRSDFTVVDGRIRFGLSAVKRVGDGAVQAIIAARDEHPIESIWDFCERVDQSVVNRGMLESLVACGALDSTGATRMGMTEVLERALSNGQKTQADAMVGQGSIFDLEEMGSNGSGPVARSHSPVGLEEWPRDELLRREKEVLGLYVSSHPLAPLRDQLARKVDVPLKALADLPDGKTVTVGGIVSGLRQLMTKRGDQMAVAELDDMSGTVEVLVFANTWEICRDALRPDAIVLIKAKVDRRSEGEVKLRALEVTPFDAVPDQEVVRLSVDARVVGAGVMDELKTLIGEYPGQAPVELEVHTSAGSKMLRLGPGFRVRPESDFLAEARALLGAAALV